MLSVGELNANKNHSVVIRAIAKLQNPSLHYAIAGTGELHDDLQNLATELGVADRVHLLGYRNDVTDLYQAADLYIHPSKREGLPVALMEAMACGLSAVCSRIRGNTDLMGEQSDFLVEPSDAVGFQKSIERLMDSPELRLECGERNQLEIEKFEIKIVLEKMKELYLSC